MNSTTSIGQRIKYARGALGWSQADLARMCNIAPTQFSRYESGRAEPRPETIAKIAVALNVNPIWLTQGKGEIEGPDIPLAVPDGFPAPMEVSLPEELGEQLRAEASANGITVEMLILRIIRTFIDKQEVDPNQDALEKASQRGAEAAIQRLLGPIGTKQENPIETGDYLEQARRLILNLDEDGNPIDHSKARTPEVRGANAPKGGSKQRRPKK